MAADLLEADEASKVSAKNWLRELFLWDTAQKQEVARAAMATGFGLNPQQYIKPFPGSNTSNVTNIGVTPPAVPQLSPQVAPAVAPLASVPPPSVSPVSLARQLLPGLGLAGLGLSGMLGTGLLTYFLSRPATSVPAAPIPVVPAAVEPAPLSPPKPREWIFRYRHGPDGEWKDEVIREGEK
jgi:hypothetical protein